MTAKTGAYSSIVTSGTDGTGLNWGTATTSGNPISAAYVPDIWSSKMVDKFYASTVFGEISNTNYEGELKTAGDTVHIRIIPTITINDYFIGGNSASDPDLTYERPAVTKTELLIDKGKYWAFQCNDVEKKQADINYVNTISQDAGEQLKITIDTAILGDVWNDAASTHRNTTGGGVISASINLGTASMGAITASTGAGVQLTKANIVDKIVELGQVLDESNIPESDRWLVLPAWACSRIKQSDLKDASLTGDSVTPLRNGKIGMIDRFTIYKSNLLKSGYDASDNKCFAIMYGHKSAMTFASQIVENEVIDNPFDFGDLMRGLMVYGYKTIKTDALGTLTGYAG